MEKIFANHISDKGLISEIYNESLQPNSQKNPSNLIKKSAKDLNSYFSKRHTNCQQVDENQNHNEISSHTC